MTSSAGLHGTLADGLSARVEKSALAFPLFVPFAQRFQRSAVEVMHLRPAVAHARADFFPLETVYVSIPAQDVRGRVERFDRLFDRQQFGDQLIAPPLIERLQ